MRRGVHGRRPAGNADPGAGRKNGSGGRRNGGRMWRLMKPAIAACARGSYVQGAGRAGGGARRQGGAVEGERPEEAEAGRALRLRAGRGGGHGWHAMRTDTDTG